MNRKVFVLLLLFIAINLIILSLDLEEIYNLSKLPETLDQSWSEMLIYIQNNPEDYRIVKYGEIISAKISLRNVYSRQNFLRHIISEDIRSFGVALGVLDNSFLIPEENTLKILKVFPNIPRNLEIIFENGDLTPLYYKEFFRLQGLENYIFPKTYMPFINYFVNRAINSASFFDRTIESFILKFIPRNNLRNINLVIQESQFILSENDYSGAFRLLSFLNNNNIISEDNFMSFTRLNNYFSLRSKINELNNAVYFVENEELNLFIEDTIATGINIANLRTEKKALTDMYLAVLKTLNTRLDRIDSHIIIHEKYDINNIVNRFDDNIRNEFIKMSLNIQATKRDLIHDTDLSTDKALETNDSTEMISLEDSDIANEKNNFSLMYIFIFIIMILLSVFIFFEIFPNHKKIYFLCNLGLGKYAIRLSQKAIIKDPQEYKNYMALAKAYENTGEYTLSFNTYKTALKLKEKNDLKNKWSE